MTVRYAVVGAGWISQIAFLPSVSLTGNSETTALVSGNPENARKLADFYRIDRVYPYEGFDEMLASDVVDAVYVALPNSMHADYAIRAARAGKHVLVEKPLAVSEEECAEMIAAAREAGVYLMTAYRLHNDAGTIFALDQIHNGAIGDPRIFSSVFSFQSSPDNHRLDASHWGGPLQDIGIYCLNAARHVFRSEPTSVWATTNDSDDARFSQVEEMIAATLTFPGGRLAQFCASFGAESLDTFQVAGTEGELSVEGAFEFKTPMRVRVSNSEGVIERTFPTTDHFAGQTCYFSDCILSGQPPEADGEEGLADVRALLAIEAAARAGQPQAVRPSPPRMQRPNARMVRKFAYAGRRLML